VCEVCKAEPGPWGFWCLALIAIAGASPHRQGVRSPSCMVLGLAAAFRVVRSANRIRQAWWVICGVPGTRES
jgi:hypothetical protein